MGGYPRVKWQASEAQAYRLTSKEWSNCVNNAIQSKVGGYPSDDWKKALNQLHVEERLIETEIITHYLKVGLLVVNRD